MIYLDNAATTFPKPESVYRAMDHFARTSLANPGRAGHKMAMEAEHAVDNCRHRLNQLFHGTGPERFIFGLNGTDALNMAIKGVVRPGDHVITTTLEHNSVSRSLTALELAGVISLTRIDPDEGGTIDPQAIADAMTPKTRLVAMTHGSNVIGTVQPIRDIGRICRARGVLLLADAAQTAGVIPIDVQADGIDLLAMPGHKCLMGPTGTGVLYVAPGVEIVPWREGGTGGDSATPTQPTMFPYYMEGGTPNVLGIVGLTAGIEFVEQKGIAAIHAHDAELTEHLWKRIEDVPGIRIYGHRDMSRHVGTLSFHSDMVPAPELGAILDQAFSIAIRPGLHCSPYAHRNLGTFPDGLVRVSPGVFNSLAEIDTFADAIREIHSV